MKCPYCDFDTSKVVDSRPIEEGNSIRRRRECENCKRKNRKYYNLFLTEKGKDFDFAHKKFDVNSIITTNRELLKTFTAEEIEIMRKVMSEYSRIISEE